MENASKALIMAAEILLGVLLLTLLVAVFQATGYFSETVEDNIQTTVVNEFNVNFENYKNKSYLTAQDVISIINLAKEYSETEYAISITIQRVSGKYTQNYLSTEANAYEFIKNNSYDTEKKDIIKFEVSSMTYNQNTGRVDTIVIKKM
jgi:hypothetical protein